MKATNITWKEIKSDIDSLAKLLEKDGFKPDCIIGIACGGLIPATLLAKKLKIKKLLSVNASSYNDKKQNKLSISNLPKINPEIKNILIIDEIADTGETLKKVLEKIKSNNKQAKIRSATLFVNKNRCKNYPDYFINETIEWINFPWE